MCLLLSEASQGQRCKQALPEAPLMVLNVSKLSPRSSLLFPLFLCGSAGILAHLKTSPYPHALPVCQIHWSHSIHGVKALVCHPFSHLSAWSTRTRRQAGLWGRQRGVPRKAPMAGDNSHPADSESALVPVRLFHPVARGILGR